MSVLQKDKLLKVEILNDSCETIFTAGPEQIFFSCQKDSQDITVIIKGTFSEDLRRGMNFYIVFHTRDGERIRYSATADVSAPMQLDLSMHTADRKVLEERRRFCKIYADLNCEIESLERGGETREYPVPHSAMIKDMNLGGIFIAPEDSVFVPEDLIKLQIYLDDPEAQADVTAEVLRVQYKDGEILGYGCRFVDLPEHEEAVLSQYIYLKQLREKYT